MTPDDLAEYLEQAHVGVIATLRRDGSPYTVPVWWLWEPDPTLPPFVAGRHAYPNGDMWLIGTDTRVWCRQLLHDPRASLCIESGPPMTAHVEVDGACEVLRRDTHDIWPMARRLAEKYVGRGDPANDGAVDAFFTNMRTEPRLLFRLRPRVLRAIDMRVYRGKRADRAHQAGEG
jgi:PPOX class probable F420-dependent enzyme